MAAEDGGLAAAAGAVLATMDAERAAQIIANMNPKKLAEAISQMELDDAKRVFASCKRGDRANILENLSLEASGSLVGALDPQSAVEALKMIEDEKYCIDILNQIKAVRNSLTSVEGKIVKTHLKECVKETLNDKQNFDDKVEEVLKVIKR